MIHLDNEKHDSHRNPFIVSNISFLLTYLSISVAAQIKQQIFPLNKIVIH